MLYFFVARHYFYSKNVGAGMAGGEFCIRLSHHFFVVFLQVNWHKPIKMSNARRWLLVSP